MSALQKEVFHIIHALPDNSLLSIRPLLNELLTSAVLLEDPHANISKMDEWDKSLFLQSVKKLNDADFVSFDEALAECGVSLDAL